MYLRVEHLETPWQIARQSHHAKGGGWKSVEELQQEYQTERANWHPPKVLHGVRGLIDRRTELVPGGVLIYRYFHEAHDWLPETRLTLVEDL